MSSLLLALLLATALQPTSDWSPLKIELPEPCYGGIPLSLPETAPDVAEIYFSPNLERETRREPFFAPKDAVIVSRGVQVTASMPPLQGNLKQIVDGDKACKDEHVVELPSGPQWIQLDLGEEKTVYAIILWHWHNGKRVYFDVVVQVSDDPMFKSTVSTLANADWDNKLGLGRGTSKEYVENHEGHLFDAKGISSQYIRCYSCGNVRDDKNHYIEVEVWGK